MGIFSPKKVVVGGVWQREKKSLQICINLVPALTRCHMGHISIWHPAQPPPEFQLELLLRPTVQRSKKIWVGKVRIQQSHPPAYGGTKKLVLYPKVSFTCSQTSRIVESVESQILSLVKHHLTHKLLITLIETWHRQESVGRVIHWKWHIYIAPLGIVLWQLCFCGIWS